LPEPLVLVVADRVYSIRLDAVADASSEVTEHLVHLLFELV